MKRWMLMAVLAVFAAGGAAAAGQDATQGTAYEQLGGREGIGRIIDAASRHIHADPRIKDLFAALDQGEQRKLFVDQLCAATGGPCEYAGRTMEEAHSGLNLTNADFDAFMSDVVAGMNEMKLAPEKQRIVLDIYGAMKPQVVGQ